MSINFVPTRIYGSMVHKDSRFKITASQVNNKWYASLNNVMFDAGFTNITSMSEFYDKFEEYEESLNMLGFFRKNSVFVNDIYKEFYSEITVKDEGTFHIEVFDSDGTQKSSTDSIRFEDIEKFILDLYDEYGIDFFESATISSSEEIKHVIEAKISTRDLSKNLVRVKSSNLWSYGIDIKDRKDKTGDVLVQFKDTHGGPGDIYQYLDVPVNLWRKWLAAPSKGHFLWQYIRNQFQYRKLTGDKRGKLPNAIN